MPFSGELEAQQIRDNHIRFATDFDKGFDGPGFDEIEVADPFTIAIRQWAGAIIV